MGSGLLELSNSHITNSKIPRMESNLPSLEGIIPVKRLIVASDTCNVFIHPSSVGKEPTHLLLETSNISNNSILPNTVGILLSNLLYPRVCCYHCRMMAEVSPSLFQNPAGKKTFTEINFFQTRDPFKK
jgi:hypothetical protein